MPEITIAGVTVEIVRKKIKNLHLAVYPPTGRVRVAAPTYVTDDAVRLAVASRIGWVRRMQGKFESQERMSPRTYVTGESHYHLGRRYRLDVVEAPGRPGVAIRNRSWIEMHANPGQSVDDRGRMMKSWQRRQLREIAAGLIEKWEPVVGVTASQWGIREMKTKWGTCNHESARIWLNLALIRMPERCIEYVVVHELAHIRERLHGDAFIAVLDTVLPQWREAKALLNENPLVSDQAVAEKQAPMSCRTSS